MPGSFAARVGDPHVCPVAGLNPHVGGPVLPPGELTVLIGGQPAALAGDKCTCAGPPDVILPTKRSVVVANRTAACMGDTTAHGGTITGGCPSVLLGG